MPIIAVGISSIKVIESDRRRNFLTFTNADASDNIWLSDQPDVDRVAKAKWYLRPGDIVYIKGFPDRAFWATSDGSNTKLVVGFQNIEAERGS